LLPLSEQAKDITLIANVAAAERVVGAGDPHGLSPGLQRSWRATPPSRNGAPGNKPKAAKPPLPPDEARDRRIKALATENRNLKAKLRIMQERYNDGLAKAGGMSFATQSAIAKVLHPDTRKQATEAELDKACKLFTSWKADKDKAQRHAR
jgi:hypothetical protein